MHVLKEIVYLPVELEKSVDEDDNPRTAEESFLQELKLQFDKEIELRKNLDTKASTMITVASAVSTLLTAIGTFLISRIIEKDIFYGISILILGVGIMLAVLGIWRFITSYSLRGYTYPMGHEWFFDQGEYNRKRVDTIRNLSIKDFSDRLYKGYLESVRTSAQLNASRAAAIKWGQKFLTGSIITTAFQVVFILSCMDIGLIKLS